MTADEIRDKLSTAMDGYTEMLKADIAKPHSDVVIKFKSDIALRAAKLIMQAEIAAQLAELNANMKKLMTTIERHYQ